MLQSDTISLQGEKIKPSEYLDWNVASKESQFMLMWMAMGLTCAMYTALTIFGLRNFFKYIVKQNNQLKLLYVLAIFAAGARCGRYIAMLVNNALGNTVHTQLSLMVDLFVSCVLVAVGLCLTLIMFKLYTYLQCWTIQLQVQRQVMDNASRFRETNKRQIAVSKRFEILKYFLHTVMVLALILTLVQMTLIYVESDYKGTSPARISALDFANSQKDLAWYSFFNIRTLFLEQGAFFAFDAGILYTAIIFLISVMSDLQELNNLMYIEGSSSLEAEKKRLRIIMFVFGTSYFLRAGFDFAIASYYVEFQTLSSDYPGFFELIQSAYFVLTDVIPISAFFWMHHQVYRQDREAVQMTVDPEARRAQHMLDTNAQYLQTVLLNIISTESSSESQERSSSNATLPQSSINDSDVLYQVGSHGGGSIYGQLSGLGADNYSEYAKHDGVNQLASRQKVVSVGSFKSVRQNGLLSRNGIRQIHSDIVTIEALSRLNPSDAQSAANLEEEEKQPKEEIFTEALLNEEKGEVPLNVDIENYNKHRNHFSKSTADEEEINVKELESMLQVTKNNRSSSHFGSLQF